MVQAKQCWRENTGRRHHLLIRRVGSTGVALYSIRGESAEYCSTVDEIRRECTRCLDH